MSTQIIDIHSHIMSEDTVRYPIVPLGGKRSDWSGERTINVEQMISAMDEAGVAKTALVNPSAYGYDNAYVADCVSAWPDRFTGVCSVDVNAPDAPSQIAYWHNKNLTGLRLFTIRGKPDAQADMFGQASSFPVWECCNKFGISVCVQLPGSGQAQLLLPQLMVLVKRFPNVTIILDHLMKPPVEEGPPYAASRYLFDLAGYNNIYLKLTTNNIRAVRNSAASTETFFPRLVKEFGAARIAWGSNLPASAGTLSELVREAQSALGHLSEEDQSWIFCRTAQRLYPALKD